MFEQIILFQLTHNTSSCLLLDININVLEHDGQVESLRELLRDSSYSLHLPSSISHNTTVLKHGAVVSQKRDLVDIGSFVRIDDEVRIFMTFRPLSLSFLPTLPYVHPEAVWILTHMFQGGRYTRTVLSDAVAVPCL